VLKHIESAFMQYGSKEEQLFVDKFFVLLMFPTYTFDTFPGTLGMVAILFVGRLRTMWIILVCRFFRISITRDVLIGTRLTCLLTEVAVCFQNSHFVAFVMKNTFPSISF